MRRHHGAEDNAAVAPRIDTPPPLSARQLDFQVIAKDNNGTYTQFRTRSAKIEHRDQLSETTTQIASLVRIELEKRNCDWGRREK